jgi:hypothetical protein
MDYPGFCGPSAQSRTLLASAERSINLMPHRIAAPSAQGRVVLYPTPGLSSFATADNSPCRGMFAQAGRCFAVIGTSLYEVYEDGTLTDRGTVAVDANPATMVTNGDGGDELFITSGDKGYILNLGTNVLTQPVNDCTMGGMVNGYFVALDASTSTFKISDLLDGTTWDATQIAQRNAASDPWKAMRVKYPVVYLFGEETTDVWYDAGTSPFPFAAVGGVQMGYGIDAPFSAETLGGSMIWLARSKDGAAQVVEAGGYDPTPISTDAVEWAINNYTRTSDAVAYTYQDNGHEYYALNFPSANVTWVFDRTERMWHERASWDSENAAWKAWGPQFHAYAFGKHLVGDSVGESLYHMSAKYYTDTDGLGLRRQRIAPALEGQDRERVYLDRLQVDLEPGVGTLSGQGEDPQIILEVSTDGGQTWTNERWRSAGKMGQYRVRAEWWRCGSGREVIPRITMTDPVSWPILGASMDVRRGAA